MRADGADGKASLRPLGGLAADGAVHVASMFCSILRMCTSRPSVRPSALVRHCTD